MDAIAQVPTLRLEMEEAAVAPHAEKLAVPLLYRSPGSNSSTPCSPSQCFPRGDRDEEARSAVLDRRFQTIFWWLALDHSTPLRKIGAYFVALVLGIGVPLLRLTLLECETCPASSRLLFVRLVVFLEGGEALIAWLFLLLLLRHSKSHRSVLFLFLQEGESSEKELRLDLLLHGQTRILWRLLLPPVAMHLALSAWWFCSNQIWAAYPPPDSVWAYGGPLATASLLLLCFASWLFQTAAFLCTCCLFWLLCTMHAQRLFNYCNYLRDHERSMAEWLERHRLLRHLLKDLSHRFRYFLLGSGAMVVAGMWSSVHVLLSSQHPLNLLNAGHVVVCNWVHVTGSMLCLQAAAKISHRAQSLVSFASAMHATISGAEKMEGGGARAKHLPQPPPSCIGHGKKLMPAAASYGSAHLSMDKLAEGDGHARECEEGLGTPFGWCAITEGWCQRQAFGKGKGNHTFPPSPEYILDSDTPA